MRQEPKLLFVNEQHPFLNFENTSRQASRKLCTVFALITAELSESLSPKIAKTAKTALPLRETPEWRSRHNTGYKKLWGSTSTCRFRLPRGGSTRESHSVR